MPTKLGCNGPLTFFQSSLPRIAALTQQPQQQQQHCGAHTRAYSTCASNTHLKGSAPLKAPPAGTPREGADVGILGSCTALNSVEACSRYHLHTQIKETEWCMSGPLGEAILGSTLGMLGMAPTLSWHHCRLAMAPLQHLYSKLFFERPVCPQSLRARTKRKQHPAIEKAVCCCNGASRP